MNHIQSEHRTVFINLLPIIFFIFPLLFSCCKNRGERRGFCIFRRKA